MNGNDESSQDSGLEVSELEKGSQLLEANVDLPSAAAACNTSTNVSGYAAFLMLFLCAITISW